LGADFRLCPPSRRSTHSYCVIVTPLQVIAKVLPEYTSEQVLGKFSVAGGGGGVTTTSGATVMVVVPTAVSVAVTLHVPAATGSTTPALGTVQVFGVVLTQVLDAVTIAVVPSLYVAVATSEPSAPPTVSELMPVRAIEEMVGGGGGGVTTVAPHPGVTSPAGNPVTKAPSLQSHCGKVELTTLAITGSWYP